MHVAYQHTISGVTVRCQMLEQRGPQAQLTAETALSAAHSSRQCAYAQHALAKHTLLQCVLRTRPAALLVATHWRYAYKRMKTAERSGASSRWLHRFLARQIHAALHVVCVRKLRAARRPPVSPLAGAARQCMRDPRRTCWG